tara:strand:+ start:593 stop:916 length:324 start_codon:yes stop_codon:yes gene_type:complete
MTYKEQIKGGKVVYDAIKGLKDKEVLEFAYGKGFKGKPIMYTLKCWIDATGEISYSVWTNFSGMNVSSLTKTRVHCYTYDMMSQRTNYSFKLCDMEIGLSVTNPNEQ